MGKGGNVRKATQLMALRSVVARYLTGPELEQCIGELRHAMRMGPNAWAFKKDEPKEGK